MIFKFNIWKHHLREALKGLLNLRQQQDDSFTGTIIPLLGNNIVDLYIGKLSMQEITAEITGILQASHHYSYPDFAAWLKGSEFKKLTLSDNSVWVLRLGFSREQYIHIHPGKHSPHTFRTSSNALKTSYYLYYSNHTEKLTLDILNKLRKEKLKLSPVRTVEELNKCRTILGFLNKYNVDT